MFPPVANDRAAGATATQSNLIRGVGSRDRGPSTAQLLRQAKQSALLRMNSLVFGVLRG